MLYLATRLNYLNQGSFEKYHVQCVEVSKIIMGLIKSLQPSDKLNITEY